MAIGIKCFQHFPCSLSVCVDCRLSAVDSELDFDFDCRLRLLIISPFIYLSSTSVPSTFLYFFSQLSSEDLWGTLFFFSMFNPSNLQKLLQIPPIICQIYIFRANFGIEIENGLNSWGSNYILFRFPDLPFIASLPKHFVGTSDNL